MLAVKGFALMDRHASIYPVGQEMVEVAALEMDPASGSTIFTLLYLGVTAVPDQLLDQFRHLTHRQIKLHDFADLFSFRLIDEQLALNHVIA